MGRSSFLHLLLLFALLSISFHHGFGRKLMMETLEVGDSSIKAEEIEGKSREMMMEGLDYNLDPEPNTNPKTGFIYGPPPRG
ncbi:hypothetical protein M5689_007548 [Euphorbia peplus]|nr:hypothetical protein M5689_007548 [Euphorbia peplus]